MSTTKETISNEGTIHVPVLAAETDDARAYLNALPEDGDDDGSKPREKRRRSTEAAGGTRSEINMRVDENLRSGDRTLTTRLLDDNVRLWCSACNCCIDSNKARSDRHLRTTKHSQNTDIYRRNQGLPPVSTSHNLVTLSTQLVPSLSIGNAATAAAAASASSNGTGSSVASSTVAATDASARPPHDSLTPAQFRMLCRMNQYSGQTSGYAPGYAQANLVILPKEYAFDFLLFCQRNPKPCPLLDVLTDGQYLLPGDINVRTDVPKYRVYEDGKVKFELNNLESVWQNEFVTFIIGCSFSFEDALLRAGLPIRHIEADATVPMYNTNISCTPAGQFQGNMVVSMRPMTPAQALLATQVTARYPRVHGAPVHIGDPAAIGISDINKPDYGDHVEIKAGEVPVFWACGVTPQAVVMRVKPRICITHAPGHMLVLDTRNDTLSFA